MIIKKLIEKIEGEAELDFTFDSGVVEDVRINFGFYRGIEEILVGKSARDALVITPRVCGICNHAHLIAAVRAIEDGYRGAGIDVSISNKARDIREFTLSCELIQNHIKWFYMTILPQLEQLTQTENDQNHFLKASHLSSTITKALAIFAGQWPHSSYAVPGGVTCDPTHIDIVQAEGYLDSAILFFEREIVGMPLDNYLDIVSLPQLDSISGDMGYMIKLLDRYGLSDKGSSHDRFITFGECMFFKSGKSIATKVSSVDTSYITESIQNGTTAKAVHYKDRQYEVGPLARAMMTKEPIIKSLHKRYKDSLLIRLYARVHEIALLLKHNKKLLNNLYLNEPSCSLPHDIKLDNFQGTGVAEAARGSLVHQTTIVDGSIENYEIIVPTQWNLSHGSDIEKGVATQAMIGSTSTEEASFIFRSFDVCSVCTTQ